MTMNDKRLQEIKARLDAIPELAQDFDLSYPNISRCETELIRPLGLTQRRLVIVAYPVSQEFADFAIQARNYDLPNLLNEVNQLRAEVKRLKDEIAEVTNERDELRFEIDELRSEVLE